MLCQIVSLRVFSEFIQLRRELPPCTSLPSEVNRTWFDFWEGIRSRLGLFSSLNPQTVFMISVVQQADPDRVSRISFLTAEYPLSPNITC